MTEIPPLEKKTGKEIIYEVEDEIDYDEYGHAVNSEDLDALHEKVWVSLESIQARDKELVDELDNELGEIEMSLEHCDLKDEDYERGQRAIKRLDNLINLLRGLEK